MERRMWKMAAFFVFAAAATAQIRHIGWPEQQHRLISPKPTVYMPACPDGMEVSVRAEIDVTGVVRSVKAKEGRRRFPISKDNLKALLQSAKFVVSRLTFRSLSVADKANGVVTTIPVPCRRR